MIDTLLGIKKGMTSSYDARGRRVGATIIELGPNFVTQVKTKDGKDQYNAVQIGFSQKKSVKKPQVGLFKKVGVEQKLRWLREVKTENAEELTPGKEIKVGDIFRSGDAVKITGVSKGKGFQGGVRRHGFHGGPKTHGQSDRHRAPGSIGSGTTPGRVFKGKKMAGHMGVDTVSILELEVISIDRTNNLLTVKGGIPGAIGSLVKVRKTGVIKGYIAPPEEKPDEDEEEEEDKDTKETNETEETKVQEEAASQPETNGEKEDAN